MENFKVQTTARMTCEERKAFEVKQLDSLIEAQSHNAQSTKRYLQMFGGCLSDERLLQLRRHLERLTSSVADMMRERDRLRYTPPVQLIFDNY